MLTRRLMKGNNSALEPAGERIAMRLLLLALLRGRLGGRLVRWWRLPGEGTAL